MINHKSVHTFSLSKKISQLCCVAIRQYSWNFYFYQKKKNVSHSLQLLKSRFLETIQQNMTIRKWNWNWNWNEREISLFQCQPTHHTAVPIQKFIKNKSYFLAIPKMYWVKNWMVRVCIQCNSTSSVWYRREFLISTGFSIQWNFCANFYWIWIKQQRTKDKEKWCKYQISIN